MKLILFSCIFLLCLVFSHADFLKKLLNKRSIQDDLSADWDKLSKNENFLIKPMDKLRPNAIFEDQACGGNGGGGGGGGGGGTTVAPPASSNPMRSGGGRRKNRSQGNKAAKSRRGN